jgi:hypothetical protein
LNPIGTTQFEKWGGSNTPPNAKKRFSRARRTGSGRFPQNRRETSRDMVVPYRKPETGSGSDFRFTSYDVTKMALFRYSDARNSISFDPIRFRFGGNGRGSPPLTSPKIATPHLQGYPSNERWKSGKKNLQTFRMGVSTTPPKFWGVDFWQGVGLLPHYLP